LRIADLRPQTSDQISDFRFQASDLLRCDQNHNAAVTLLTAASGRWEYLVLVRERRRRQREGEKIKVD
jgi:hypothetical protein